QRGDAPREEVEGGHPRGAAAGGTDGLGGEDEGEDADAARAEACEEAQRGVGPVGRGQRGEEAEGGVEDADYLEGALPAQERVREVAEHAGACTHRRGTHGRPHCQNQIELLPWHARVGLLELEEPTYGPLSVRAKG